MAEEMVRAAGCETGASATTGAIRLPPTEDGQR
jgi:hypothetical protein